VRLSRNGLGGTDRGSPTTTRTPGPADDPARTTPAAGASTWSALLARDWGVLLSPPGKTVLFELDLVDQQGKRKRRSRPQGHDRGDGPTELVRGCDARVGFPCTTAVPRRGPSWDERGELLGRPG